MSIIIIGAGQIGQFIASKLSSENKDVIVIENNEAQIEEVSEKLDAKVILGNGASPAILREAGIKNAQMLIAVTNSDEVNLLACTLANAQTTIPIKVARVRNIDFYHPLDQETLKKLNINMIINPDKVAADAILRVLSAPGALDVLEFFGGKMKVVGIKIDEDSEFTNITLEKLDILRKNNNILISTIVRDGEIIIPTGQHKILAGDIIYFATKSDNVPDAMKSFGIKAEKIKRVMIHGGGFIGLYLAKYLEETDVQVKIIEKRQGLCRNLVRNLNKAVVLNESATDQTLLTQENVHEMDAFISVTSDDEDNILSSLLAKRLGAPWAITLTTQISYIPLITKIGVDVAISPRLLSNSAILHFIRQGKVLSVSSLHEDIEILEIEALETSNIVNTPIRRAKLPKGSLILSIEREGKVLVPDGRTVVVPGDKVLVQTNTASIKKIEKLFTVKMEYF